MSINRISFSKSNYDSLQTSAIYEPVNIYRVKSSELKTKAFKMTDWFRKCCFCFNRDSSHVNDDFVEDSNSSLVGHIGKSYTLNSPRQTSGPIITVTRVIDNDTQDVSTTLIKSEAADQSDAKISQKEALPNSENCSSVKTGEKMSFILEVLTCRDAFIKSLEWCDNSLMRNKKYRQIKRDDWIELQNDGRNLEVKSTYFLSNGHHSVVAHNFYKKQNKVTGDK